MKGLTSLLAVVAIGGTAVLSAMSPAQSAGDILREIDRRRGTENQWRNGAYAGGAAALAGVLLKNNTLTYAGLGGGLYSFYRYEQDRKSRNRLERQRAAFYSAPYRTYRGQRFKRVKVRRNGQQFYQYVRAR